MRGFFHLHFHFLLALAGGLAWYHFAPHNGNIYRITASWDAGIVFYLLQIIFMMRKCDEHAMRKRAKSQDIHASALLVTLISAAFFSLFAILHILKNAKDMPGEHAYPLVLAALTVVLSWLLVQTLFAIHYAHNYFAPDKHGKDPSTSGGLAFPGNAADNASLNYWDFMYYAFVVGMTFQVSDVQITSRPMRHLTLAHAVIAFFFNTFILALSVNIAASAF